MARVLLVLAPGSWNGTRPSRLGRPHHVCSAYRTPLFRSFPFPPYGRGTVEQSRSMSSGTLGNILGTSLLNLVPRAPRVCPVVAIEQDERPLPTHDSFIDEKREGIKDVTVVPADKRT